MKNVSYLKENGVNVDKSLELFGDIETYDNTLIDFITSVDKKLSEIKQYKEISDMKNYAILVHSLKSDAKYFGFEKLADLSYQHELQSKANNALFVVENYDALMIEANRIVKLVKEYLGLIPTSPIEQVKEVPVIGNKENAILVVDDADVIRSFIMRIFNGTIKVIAAHDGNEAINIIENNKTDNIRGMLLDLYMPNCDGFQVLEYFKQHNLFNKIPVSIITGEDQQEPIRRAFSYPIIDMISKPFNEQNIKLIVEKTIDYNTVI